MGLDKPGDKFLIRLGDGSFYRKMIGADIQGTPDPLLAFHFQSRMAAVQVCATTHKFAGSYIVAYDASPAQPEAQGAIRATGVVGKVVETTGRETGEKKEWSLKQNTSPSRWPCRSGSCANTHD